MGRSSVHRVTLLVLLAAGGSWAFGAGAAAAAGPPPAPGLSAVWQYTEAVPTSKGAALEKGGRSRQTQLPPKVDTALAQSSSPVDQVLRSAATSSKYGAPTAPRRVTKTKAAAKANPPTRRVAQSQVRASSAGYAADTRLVVLAALMSVGLVSALGLRLLARRRPPPGGPRR